MGMLVEGVWKDVWYDTKETKGHFKRGASQFRNWVTVDGTPALRAKAVSRRRRIATTSMSPSPAPGRTGP